MSTVLVFVIIFLGISLSGFIVYFKVKKHGRQILPWTREAKAIRAIKREEELQASIRRVLQSQKDDWNDQFGG